MRTMKYFRHILIGHEIFIKIFDGPQNIFLCSVFKILFFEFQSLSFLKRFKKDLTCLINRIHSADIRQILVKIKKIMHFDPDARVFVLSN